MAITKIKYQSACPYGHENIDFIDLVHRQFIFCYNCNKKYIQKDFEA